MQTQIGPSVLVALAIPFTLGVAAAVAAHLPTLTREQESEASELWKAHRLRGGVTAPSPWHSSTSTINTPALVEVHPAKANRTPCDRTLPLPLSSTPDHQHVPTPVREVSAPAADCNASASTDETPRSATASIEETNRQVVLDLHSQGLSKTKIIKHVWQVSPGGSKAYRAARDLYESILSEVEVNA